ncbi:hypothetical protein M426DRAFT_15158 [Hypoxylon sp. CI-4A]|nr:hypothetical protein M426DRAFT_15158 [Hypoxylon sp. CI-4A]
MAATLLAELLYTVLEDSCITLEDLKSARLVSKYWTTIPTDLLFRRIGMSRLKKDHDAFFNIASRPHLANSVRILVWYELENDLPNGHTAVKEGEGVLDVKPGSILREKLLELYWFSLQIALVLRECKSPTEELKKFEDFMVRF